MINAGERLRNKCIEIQTMPIKKISTRHVVILNLKYDYRKTLQQNIKCSFLTVKIK